ATERHRAEAQLRDPDPRAAQLPVLHVALLRRRRPNLDVRAGISDGPDRYAAPVPEAAASDLPAIGVRPVLAAALRTYRRRFGVIVGAAIVVFGISATVDVLTDVLADEFADKPALIALVLTLAGLAVFGTEFFAGLTDRIAGQEERGHP